MNILRENLNPSVTIGDYDKKKIDQAFLKLVEPPQECQLFQEKAKIVDFKTVTCFKDFQKKMEPLTNKKGSQIYSHIQNCCSIISCNEFFKTFLKNRLTKLPFFLTDNKKENSKNSQKKRKIDQKDYACHYEKYLEQECEKIQNIAKKFPNKKNKTELVEKISNEYTNRNKAAIYQHTKNCQTAKRCNLFFKDFLN